MKSITLITLFLLSACVSRAEVKVQIIELAAPLNRPEAQLSGLTWCGDELILLPQKPRFTSADEDTLGFVYTLEKADILAAITQASSLVAHKVLLNDALFRKKFVGFDGYEAIVCTGDKLWLAIETRLSRQQLAAQGLSTKALAREGNDKARFGTAIVAAKRISRNHIEVMPETLSTIKSISGLWNQGDETLLLNRDSLISIHERNTISGNPTATQIELSSAKQQKLSMPSLPFRVTDATEIDADKRFWVTNYLWPGDPHRIEGEDWLAKQYPAGASHKARKSVERLIELELTETGIRLSDTSPIYLRLEQDQGRNWEGVVRINDLGFLIVSDQHPETYFGFVPLPD